MEVGVACAAVESESAVVADGPAAVGSVVLGGAVGVGGTVAG